MGELFADGETGDDVQCMGAEGLRVTIMSAVFTSPAWLRGG